MQGSAQLLRVAPVALAFGVLALTSATQIQELGEVRINSHPYRPALVRAESNEVEVAVVVLDEKGRAVTGLKAEDFSVYDDGKKQQLSGFSILNRAPRANIPPESPPAGPNAEPDLKPQPKAPTEQPGPESRHPRYVALFFDDFHTKSGDIRHVQIAAREFIRKGLSRDDSVGLFTVSGSPSLEFTTDTSRALDTLSKLTSHQKEFQNSSCPRMTAHDAYLIVNNLDPDAYNTALTLARQCNCDDVANRDASCYRQQEILVQALAREVWAPTRTVSQETLDSLRSILSHLGKMPGERVLLVASSGFYAGEMQNLVDDAVNDALRSGIVINAIDAKGLYPEFQDPADRAQGESCLLCPAGMVRLRHESESFGPSLLFSEAPMTAFAIGTGGQFFHNRNDFTAGYSSLGVAPETEYLLGFSPDKAKLNGAFHKLRVEVSKPGKFEVQARPGYFARAKESSGPSADERIDREVRGSEERSEFPLAVTEQDQAVAGGGRKISIAMRVDIQKLPFKRQDERLVDILTFVAALFDAEGKMITGEEAQTQLALKPETFESFSKSGLSIVTSLKAAPGMYRLRVVMVEAVKGKMSATNQNVQIQ